MAITTHTAMIAACDESLLRFSGTPEVGFGVVSLVEVVGELVISFTCIDVETYKTGMNV